MNDMKEYTTRQWTLEEFKTSRDIWTELLHSSNADPLFSSWEWQYSWWTASHNENKELHIITIYLHDELIALAPLFTYKTRLKKIIPVTRCQLIGCSYDLEDYCRSDNLDIIIRKGINLDLTYQLLFSTINKLNWHEFIVDGANIHSHIWSLTKLNRAYTKIKIERKIYNYTVKFNGKFQEYTKKLKKKVRQKSILHRRFIEINNTSSPSMITGNSTNNIVTFISGSNCDFFFSELNRLKYLRWNKAVYKDNRLAFQQQFIHFCLSSQHLKATPSFININNKNQSAFYSVQSVKKNYFLQYAFNPNFSSKISLGYLHLAYVIEKGFETELTELQLLPGGGQNEGYKHHFANKIQPQLTYRLVSGKILCFLLFLNHLLKYRL